MTQPQNPDQPSNGAPNAQPPHSANQPDPGQQQQRPPVVVNAAPDNRELTTRMNELAQTVSGLPEAIVNFFREATQPAVDPQQTVQTGNAGGSGAQAPGSTNTPPAPPASVEQQVTGGNAAGRKPSRFAAWWYKR